MKKTIVLGACVLGMLSPLVMQGSNLISSIKEIQISDEVTATITKKTTEQELDDLKIFFKENGIELILNQVKFNDKNEIVGLDITLQKGNSKSKFSANSSVPIEDLELGYKDNNLFISNTGVFDIASWRNQSNFAHPSMRMLDSIMSNGGFGIDMADLKDQIMNASGAFRFSFENGNQEENEDFFFKDLKPGPKFKFRNDPNLEKLIIIDGKESTFEKLDQLAKADQLDTVDFLKSATAISIYGDKAKDGAIIAITKKE